MSLYRIKTFFISLALGWLLLSRPAYADVENIQNILKFLDTIEKKLVNYYEDFQNVKRGIQDDLTGIKGTIQDAKDAANDIVGEGQDLINQGTSLWNSANGLIRSPLDGLLSTAPEFIEDINDLDSTIEDVQENIVPKVSRVENSVEYQKHQEKVNDILREQLASMYAFALVQRSEIAKEKASGAEEIDTTNERKLIQASADSITKTVVRLINIYQMEAAMFEYEAVSASGKSGQRTDEE